MAKQFGLNRGLNALLGGEGSFEDTLTPAPQGEAVIRIPIDKIDPNAAQPRRRFDKEALEQLADSIRSVGVLQPVLVHKTGDRYMLIAGERRWRASRMAGQNDIPAIVRDMDATARAEAALIENLQRDDLNVIDEACAIRSLMDECGYTQETAAERLGKSRPAVANVLRLLALPAEIIEMLREGKLTAGHGRALAGLSDRTAQLRLANLAIAQGWSVRQMEKVCAAQTGKQPEKKPEPPKAPELSQLEQMARRAFGTRAELEGSETRGKLTLRYYSKEDLQRIYDVLDMMAPEE